MPPKLNREKVIDYVNWMLGWKILTREEGHRIMKKTDKINKKRELIEK